MNKFGHYGSYYMVLSNMDHIIWLILYVSAILWFISYGRYHGDYGTCDLVTSTGCMFA